MVFFAVIVTYNRKELLRNNLMAIIGQTERFDRIIIVDNHSSDGTQDMVIHDFQSLSDTIDYQYMPENTGGAGGFSYGVKYAYENGANFIYLMDDDGKPFNPNTFEIMKTNALEIYRENKLLFLNSLVTTNGEELSFGFWPHISKNKQLDEIKRQSIDGRLMNHVNPFNGTLISRELVEKIGYPRAEFFLSRDETDYMKRSAVAGAYIATIIDSIYCHPASKMKFRRILNLYVVTYADIDREYYYVRNASYTYNEVKKSRILVLCLIRVVTILLYENQKALRIKTMIQAVSDAINKRMGKRRHKEKS